MQVVMRKIRDLKPYKNNAKKHPKEQVNRIAESIKEFGFTQPVLIDNNMEVVVGHGRILGAKQAGLKEVPTVMLEDLTEEQIKAYRLIDNKLNESDWDEVLLAQELEELSDVFDMNMFGDWSIGEKENEEQKEKYTRKINAPLYEIRGDKPDITELYNAGKTKELLQRIKESSISEEEKKFLKLAAQRHTVFNYSKIAEYYAQAGKEMQELMEESALVILDYNRALELGYVNLMNGLLEMNEDDEQDEF